MSYVRLIPRPSKSTVGSPIPILMYHSVESSLRPPQYKHFYVHAKEFAWQMLALKRAGYTPLTFSQLDNILSGIVSCPRKPILLTFDDGYENLLTNVHPLLHKLNFAYTVFLVSSKVGGTNDWVTAEGYEPTALLGWSDILRMQSEGGVSFEAHTASHPHLAKIPASRAVKEMQSSRDLLQEKLQAPVTVICYPYGNVNKEVAEAAKDIGYRLAVTTQTGRVRVNDDRMLLPRISVYHVPSFSLTYGSGAMNFWWRVLLWKDKRQ